MSDKKHMIELPVVGAIQMDRRHALKIMAIAAATPGLVGITSLSVSTMPTPGWRSGWKARAG